MESAAVTTLICAWCGFLIRKGVGPVSHGICRPCADAMLAQMVVNEQGGSCKPVKH